MKEPLPADRPLPLPASTPGQRLRPFAAATLIVGIAAIVAPVLQRLPHANLSLLFMTGVLVVAFRYGLWPSIYASVLSFLLYNFFFTSPYLTLKVSEEGDVATLVFFLVMASLSGNLAARVHDATTKREKALRRTVELQADLDNARLVSERERVRAALLSSVSHDLRTPLSSIIGAASSLAAYEASLSSSDKSALLQSVIEEAERLDRHIQNLLDMTRLGQGELRLRREWEDVHDLLSAAARRLHLSRHGIHLRTDVEAGAEIIYVHGDLIEQVFVNLFDNAVRHAPEPVEIGVRATRDGECTLIEVTDDGPGIPAGDREQIFEPFYRLRDGDSRSGAGLGLSICRGIVRAHGGELTAHANDSGRGTRMRIRLPDAGRPPRVSQDEPD